MKCSKCQYDNPDTSTFCGGCATRLIPVENELQKNTETLQSPSRELKRGTLIAGRYEVIEELGRGGMGKVYKVFDTKIDEEVAIKLIAPEIACDQTVMERFSNELKLTRKISQRNICRMYDLNEDKGIHFITMEYVPGEDLRSLIRRIGQLSVAKTISIAQQICTGLMEAHGSGIIHRDLKPGNIMIDKDGNTRIMDFGIARSLRSKKITSAGMIIGTPEYMSPEQVDAKEADARSDIYSFGIIMYEMLTGKVPFEGGTPISLAVKHKNEVPKDPRELNPQIPPRLGLLILKCLEKEREKRFQSMQEVITELDEIEKNVPITEKSFKQKRTKTSKQITVTFSMKKLVTPVLIILGLAVVAVSIWLLFFNKKTPVEETALKIPPKAEIESTVSSSEVKTEQPPAVKQKEEKEVPEKTEEPKKLDLAIKAFDQGDFDGCIQQMQEILREDPQNDMAKRYLSRAATKKSEKLKAAEINNRIRYAQKALDSRDYRECLVQADRILELDPENSKASEFSKSAKDKIKENLTSLIKNYSESIKNNNMLEFLKKRCSSKIYPNVRNDMESITEAYSGLQSGTSNISVQLDGYDKADVSFTHIMIGKSKKDGVKRSVFEGVIKWKMQLTAKEWKIIGINSIPTGK